MKAIRSFEAALPVLRVRVLSFLKSSQVAACFLFMADEFILLLYLMSEPLSSSFELISASQEEHELLVLRDDLAHRPTGSLHVCPFPPSRLSASYSERRRRARQLNVKY